MNDRELRARYLTEVLATLYPPSDGGRVAHFVAIAPFISETSSDENSISRA